MTLRAESISSTPAEQSSTLPESGGASDQPPDPVQSQTEVAAAVIEEAEILHASVKAGSVAQVVVAAIAVLGLIYLLKLVLVTTLSAMLLAFILEPLVCRLTRIGIPRGIASLCAVVLMVTVAAGLTYFFYNRGVDFATQLPKYSGKIRVVLGNLRAQTNKIEESTRNVIASPKDGRQPVPVQVQEAPGLSHVVSESVSTFGRSCPGNQLRSFPGVLYADLERSRPHNDRASLPKRTSHSGPPYCGSNYGNDPQFHHRQPQRRAAECHRQHGCVLAIGYSVLLFFGRDQRIRYPNSLPGRLPGSAASACWRRWSC
jgi:AI-2E family transporter